MTAVLVTNFFIANVIKFSYKLVMNASVILSGIVRPSIVRSDYSCRHMVRCDVIDIFGDWTVNKKGLPRGKPFAIDALRNFRRFYPCFDDERWCPSNPGRPAAWRRTRVRGPASP